MLLGRSLNHDSFWALDVRSIYTRHRVFSNLRSWLLSMRSVRLRGVISHYDHVTSWSCQAMIMLHHDHPTLGSCYAMIELHYDRITLRSYYMMTHRSVTIATPTWGPSGKFVPNVATPMLATATPLVWVILKCHAPFGMTRLPTWDGISIPPVLSCLSVAAEADAVSIFTLRRSERHFFQHYSFWLPTYCLWIQLLAFQLFPAQSQLECFWLVVVLLPIHSQQCIRLLWTTARQLVHDLISTG